MNVSQSLDLVLYGLMVVGLNWLAQGLAPGFTGPTSSLTTASGLILLLLGVLGFGGLRRRWWPAVILSFIAILLSVQSARVWFALRNGADELKPVALIFFLLLFFAVGQLMNFAQAGRDLRPKPGQRKPKRTSNASAKVQHEEGRRSGQV